MTLARFREVMPESTLELERQREGWLLVMDQAIGNAMIIGAGSREQALWIMRALNAADELEQWPDGETREFHYEREHPGSDGVSFIVRDK